MLSSFRKPSEYIATILELSALVAKRNQQKSFIDDCVEYCLQGLLKLSRA